jgi:hypothetical protein
MVDKAARYSAILALVVSSCSKPTATTFTSGGADVPAEHGRTYRFAFDEPSAGAAPNDFITVLGSWKVTADHALRQEGTFGSPDFPRTVLKDLTFDDLTVRVRCKPESGSTDQACGLMFRLVDSDNYFITRANALEGNVRLYRVVRGDRQQIASADAKVTANVWHTLAAIAKGDHLSVEWDGVRVIDANDATFKRGKIGLWTKADSVTSFDDLEVVAD